MAKGKANKEEMEEKKEIQDRGGGDVGCIKEELKKSFTACKGKQTKRGNLPKRPDYIKKIVYGGSHLDTFIQCDRSISLNILPPSSRVTVHNWAS